MNNNYLIALLVSSLLTIGFIFAIYKNVYGNGKLTCDNYFINTYLYTLLGLSLIPIIYVFFVWSGIIDNMNRYYATLSFGMFFVVLIIQMAVLIGLFYLLRYINPVNTILNHSVWLILLAFIILLFSGGFKLLTDAKIPWIKTILWQAFGALLIIIVIGFLLGYYYGDKIKVFKNRSIKTYIFFGLMALTIGSMFIVANDIKTLITVMYVISILWLIYFIAVFVDNNHLLFEDAKKCVEKNETPDYPLKSIRLIINLINIFSELIKVLLFRRLRSSVRKIK